MGVISRESEKKSVRVVQGAIDVDAALRTTRAEHSEQCGAVLSFIGRVRSETSAELGSLVALDYRVYREMAVRLMRRIAEEAIAEFGLEDVLLWHSEGVVQVGQAAFVVSVSAPHRREAVAGLSAIVERTKHEAPIWKREVWSEGRRWKSAIDETIRGASH